MRLQKQFLMEFGSLGPQGGRGIGINEDEALEMLGKHCQDAIEAYKDDKVLFRGADYRFEYQIIDPKANPRRSQYTNNYYTLLIDNLPYYKNFPKRSESMICSTAESKAGGYGTMHCVFAFDGSRYGVGSDSDIWSSYYRTMKNNDLGWINRQLIDLSQRFIGRKPNETSWRAFKNDIINISIEISMAENLAQIYNGLLDMWKEQRREPFDKWFFRLYDPKPNNIFVTKDLYKVFGRGPQSKEVWTDGKCIVMTEQAAADLDIHQFL